MHFWCAAHSLNLGATTDCQAALKTHQYKRLYHPIFGKLQALWHKYNQLPKFANKYQQHFPYLGLVTPTARRWTSHYNSVQRILKLQKMDSTALAAVFVAAGQSPLAADHISFLEEWVNVTQNVAMTLDLLQGDEGIYLGYLLPAIQQLKEELEECMEKVTTCKPLANAALEGVKERFDCYSHSTEMLVAAAYLPEVKVDFLDDEGKKRARENLIEAANIDGPKVTASQEKKRTSFFAKRAKREDTAEGEVDRFLSSGTLELESVLHHKRIKEVSMHYNSVVAGSW